MFLSYSPDGIAVRSEHIRPNLAGAITELLAFCDLECFFPECFVLFPLFFFRFYELVFNLQFVSYRTANENHESHNMSRTETAINLGCTSECCIKSSMNRIYRE